MSQENVEVVRQVFDAWNQHDADLLVSYLAPDVEMDWSESIGLNPGVYRGRAEIKAYYERFLDAWEAARWEPVEVLELDDDRLLSVNRTSARGRHSGVEIEASAAVLWTVLHGKIARAKMFQSKSEALEAAGLSK